jgi:hypothetical protein
MRVTSEVWAGEACFARKKHPLNSNAYREYTPIQDAVSRFNTRNKSSDNVAVSIRT